MASDSETGGPLTRLLIRLTTDDEGNLRSARLLANAFLAALFVAVGTSIAIAAAGAGSPATLTIWVVVAFLGVKLPLLGLLWWILGRRRRDEEPSDDQIRGMLARLNAAADGAARVPDAPDRLAILKEEAWYVADHAPDELKSEAAELALRLDALARVAAAGGDLRQHAQRPPSDGGS